MEAKTMLGDFRCLKTPQGNIEVDRCVYISNLGVFFFNGDFDDDHLVYEAIGYENPVLVGDEHYFVRDGRSKNRYEDLYVKKDAVIRAPLRKSSVAVGDSCIKSSDLNKIVGISLSQGIIDGQLKETPSDCQLELLQLQVERTKVIGITYGDHLHISSEDCPSEWMKSSEVYTHKEAIDELMSSVKEMSHELSELVARKSLKSARS